MTAFRACLRYELRMQLRKRSVWITTGALCVLTVVASPANIGKVFAEPDPSAAMAFAVQLVTLLLPVGFGVLLADRLVRDDQLNVRQVLDATPAGPDVRLGGKYAGACLAGGLPIIGTYLLLAVGHGVRHGDPAALGYALAISVIVLAPALLFVGAFALLCPLVMPAPLFRVLFVGYWFWANLVHPAIMPTLNHTLLRPVSGYVLDTVFGAGGALSGPVSGAALNLLRPAATEATAWASVAVLLVMAVLALAGARVLLARTTR
jgi:ABC-2 type transport system permease protein